MPFPHYSFIILSLSNLHARFAMTQCFLRSYPVRFAFVLGAIAATIVIVYYHILVKKDFNLFRANSRPISS